LNRSRKFLPYRPSRIQWFVLLSLFAHGLVFTPRTREYAPYTPPANSPIEVTEMSPEEVAKLPPLPKEKKKSEPEVAETEQVPNNQVDPEAQFLSEKNQKVEKQTKAQLVDDFRKKQGTGMKNSLSRANTPPPTGESEVPSKDQDLGTAPDPSIKKPAGIKRNWKTLTLRDLGLGGNGGPTAATDDRLAEVAKGDRTVLSTREFKFFSYYHRIKETLRQYWKPNVERKLAMLWSRGTQMRDAELVTQVVVMLDKSGAVARITRMGSSGLQDLDDAAMEAFREAAPFPNPPAGMIDPDGYVRIRWDFILRTEASPQISFRGGGGRP
jgi:TonB family protein